MPLYIDLGRLKRRPFFLAKFSHLIIIVIKTGHSILLDVTVPTDTNHFWCLNPRRLFMKRSRIPAAKSKRDFTRGARAVHPKNHVSNPMRGGIRL